MEKISRKIIISQSILWATSILVVSLVESKESSWLFLAVLATLALGSLKKQIKLITN
jgi:hypothetical protein